MADLTINEKKRMPVYLKLTVKRKFECPFGTERAAQSAKYLPERQRTFSRVKLHLSILAIERVRVRETTSRHRKCILA